MINKYFPVLIGIAAVVINAWAGLPPTTSKLSSDSSGVTTFNYQFPNFTGTHTGVSVSLGVNDVAGGGTGLSSATAYSLLAGGTTSTGNFQQISGLGASGQILTSNGPGTLPTWQNAGSPSFSGLTQYGVIYAGSSTSVLSTAAGTVNYPLVSNATSAPTFKNLGVTGGGTGLTSDVAYAIFTGGTTSTSPYQQVSGLGTSGQILTSNGSGALPTWQNSGGGTFYAPTVQVFTSGSSTYTLPTSPRTPLYIKVTLSGGGGGGGGNSTAGQTGGTTTFGTSLLSATGGVGGMTTGGAGSGGAPSISSPAVALVSLVGGSGSIASTTATAAITATGGIGGTNPFGGAGTGGNGNVNTGSPASANTGAGGGGAGNYGTATLSLGGGGAGGYLEAIISSPSSTYSYSVGAAGSAGSVTGSYEAGSNGGSGIIIVQEFYE
jgi:hypothetical protein